MRYRPPFRPPARRAVPLFALLALLALACGGGAGNAPPVDAQPPPAAEPSHGYLEGRIERVHPDGGHATVQVEDGRRVEAQLPQADPRSSHRPPPFRAGERVELYVSPGPDGEAEYVVADWVRRPALMALAGLFLLVALVVARFKGLRAVVSTTASLVIVVGFIVPRILAGADPVWVSLLGIGGILVLAIYFVHGLSWSTTAALLGTIAAVVLTMLLGIAFSDWARLTGLGSDDAMLLAGAAPQVALRGLLLAALLIGALGALTDITIVQASVVRELAHLEPQLGLAQLYRRGMNVGLDHVGSLVNTLVLAYTGAALPLMVLLTSGEVGLRRALNLELVAAEVVHTLVGSIGLILAVPLTTVLAAFLFRGDRLPLREGELAHHHH